MSDPKKIDPDRVRARKSLTRGNLFARLPAVNAASRSQGQKLLQHGGGLSSVEWRTLWDLHDAGPMTVRDLAEVQQADHSLLSRALPQMRRKGYVTMARDPKDGRQMIVALAPGGIAAYNRAAPIMARRRAALQDIFTEEEIGVFLALFDRFEEFVRAPIDDIVGQTETAD